jgi:hypothetical protein
MRLIVLVEPHAGGRDCRWSRGEGLERDFPALFHDARMRRFGGGGKMAPDGTRTMSEFS